MVKILENVKVSWAFLDKDAPTKNFDKLQWSINASVSKEVAMEFKKLGYIKSLRSEFTPEGDTTGNYLVTFKQNATTANGKAMRAPGVYTKSADGTISPLKNVIIGNGSTCTISYSTYDWEFKGRKGTSTALKNVLVTELVEFKKASVEGSEFGTMKVVKAEGDEFKTEVKKSVESVSLDLDEDDDF